MNSVPGANPSQNAHNNSVNYGSNANLIADSEGKDLILA
jgi:hypothetical protein